LVFAVLGCAAGAQAPPSGLRADPTVAIVNGKEISESAMLAAARTQLLVLQRQEYDAKRRALDTLIDRQLLEAEATRRGITVAELTRIEIDDKVAEPTDAEIEAYRASRRRAGQKPLAEVREDTRVAVRVAKLNEARAALVGALRERYGVRVLLPPFGVEVASDARRLKGDAEAPVRIVVFSDFECPYCRSVQPAVRAALERYAGKVSYAYRDFALTNAHPHAQAAAEASRCAAEQGRFWEYHDRLFAESELATPDLKRYARDLGLDSAAFDACVDGRAHKAAVDRDGREGRAAGVTGTPTFFVNGVRLAGAQPLSAFVKAIDDALAHVSPSAQRKAGD
jgi:predicted DsbA family dithiol-disulfide isomerase